MYVEFNEDVYTRETASNINKLENTQKFALKVCTKHWNLGYQDLLELTVLLSKVAVYILSCVPSIR